MRKFDTYKPGDQIFIVVYKSGSLSVSLARVGRETPTQLIVYGKNEFERRFNKETGEAIGAFGTWTSRPRLAHTDDPQALKRWQEVLHKGKAEMVSRAVEVVLDTPTLATFTQMEEQVAVWKKFLFPSSDQETSE